MALFRTTNGEIRMELFQSSFVAGDIVRGVAHVTIYKPILVETLAVKLVGVEKVKWTEKPSMASQQAQHPRIRQVHRLITTPDVMRVGDHSFPFSFDLPSALPGVFTMKPYTSDSMGKMGAIVRYTLEAIVEIAGGAEENIQCKDILVVHEKFMGKPKLRQDSAAQPVRFSLFTKGVCSVGASIARDVYYPGQAVHVKWEISSSLAGAMITVKEIHTRLIQVLNITLGFESMRTFSRYLTSTKTKGLPAATSIVHFQPLPLVSASEGFVNPTTTTGSNVVCRYLLELECKLDGASDKVVMRIPIRILGPCVQCPGVVVTQPVSDDEGLALALRSSSVNSR